jgi:hypothetical protein
MLKARDLPGKFWGAAVMTAIYVLNRSSMKGDDDKMLYELWIGSTPSVQHLCTFGSVAHLKDARPHLHKLDDSSNPMIFVGYEPISMAYRIHNPMTKHIHITWDVVFDEDGKWRWEDRDVNTKFIIDYVLDDILEVVIAHHGDQAVSPAARTPAASPAPAVATPHTSSPPGDQVTPGPAVMHVSALVGAEVTLDADHDEWAPLRFCTLQNIDEAGSALGLIQQELRVDLVMVDTEEPASF